jgi:succinate dehydrogenase/fumarate reductase flavoprotein subunit
MNNYNLDYILSGLLDAGENGFTMNVGAMRVHGSFCLRLTASGKMALARARVYVYGRVLEFDSP